MKPSYRTRTTGRSRGGTLLGVFVGLVLGLAIAAAVAYYLGRSGLTTALPATGSSREPVRGKTDTAVNGAQEKPRFDFYKILPGSDEPKPTLKPPEKTAPAAITKAPETQAVKVADRLWLQAGAFGNASDAENLKARLALSGWEAAIQPTTLPDKSTRYRVRLGPYDNNDELNRIKAELGKGGFDVAVIRNQ